MLKKYILRGLIILFFTFNVIVAQDGQTLLKEARNHYQKANYKQALPIYQKLAAAYPYNPDIWFNLGNTYFKLDELGKAIWYYKKVLKFAPRDKDAQKNLGLAQAKIIDRVKPLPLAVTLNKIINYFTINFFLLGLLGIGFLANLFLFFYRRGKGPKQPFYVYILIGGLLLLFVVMFSLKTYQEFGVRKGVLVGIKKVAVKSGPTQSLKTLFYIHDGVQFKISKKVDNWVKIKLTNGWTGWLNNKYLWEI